MGIESGINDYQWYAVYTRSRTEKKAHDELVQRGIICFLPMHKVLRQWSDRKKWVETPLFNSYLFVRISPKEYLQVLQISGLVRFITFEGKAVPIPPQQIEAIKVFLEQGAPDFASEEVHLLAGAAVEITRGTMIGLTGILLHIAGKHRVKVEIDCVGQSLILNVPKSSLTII
ncbi:MAG: UpxY family transcription antiterminator [Bacteroidales bacterium]